MKFMWNTTVQAKSAEELAGDFKGVFRTDDRRDTKQEAK